MPGFMPGSPLGPPLGTPGRRNLTCQSSAGVPLQRNPFWNSFFTPFGPLQKLWKHHFKDIFPTPLKSTTFPYAFAFLNICFYACSGLYPPKTSVSPTRNVDFQPRDFCRFAHFPHFLTTKKPLKPPKKSSKNPSMRRLLSLS